jgi:4a-hydroxytetrahydrobiopterin dehydratase
MQHVHGSSPPQPGALAAPPGPPDRLKAERVQEKLAALPHWELAEEGDSISRSFSFHGPAAPLAFASLVGAMAQELGHYPAVTIVHRTVFCRLSSRDVGGLTLHDFELAKRISLLP